MSNLLNRCFQVLDYTFQTKAPKDTGNLGYSMQSTPTIIGNVAIIELGKDWSSRTNKKDKYNYGQLLNDKRIIKNRESKKRQTRLENREKRKFSNSRSLWVKDKKYGNTIKITNRQYEISVKKSRTDKKYQQFNETNRYEFIRNDNSVPPNSGKPTRTNIHYHYLDYLFDEYSKNLARTLGGKLHKGDYKSKKTKTSNTEDIFKDYFNNLLRGNLLLKI